MTMQDWEIRLNRFIEATDRQVLQDTGRVTAEIAKAHAESEFEKYRIVQDQLFVSDFDRVLQQLDAGDRVDGTNEDLRETEAVQEVPKRQVPNRKREPKP